MQLDMDLQWYRGCNCISSVSWANILRYLQTILMAWWNLLIYNRFISQDDFTGSNGFTRILNDFEWYKLPVELQKDFQILLGQKQNSATLSAGPLGKIKLELFTDVQLIDVSIESKINQRNLFYFQISKRIYSFLMYLINFGG